MTEIVKANLHDPYCSNMKPARVRQLTRRSKTLADAPFKTMQEFGHVIIRMDDDMAVVALCGNLERSNSLKAYVA